MCGQTSSVTATSCMPAARGEAHRVVEQGLGGADLDQRRRQAREVGIEHGDARVLAVHPGRHVGGGQLLEVALVDERVDGVLGGERGAGHGEVGPGRHQPGAGGQLLAGLFQPVDQRDGEPAAGAVAADGDVLGRHTRRRARSARRLSASSGAAGKGCSGASR